MIIKAGFNVTLIKRNAFAFLLGYKTSDILCIQWLFCNGTPFVFIAHKNKKMKVHSTYSEKEWEYLQKNIYKKLKEPGETHKMKLKSLSQWCMDTRREKGNYFGNKEKLPIPLSKTKDKLFFFLLPHSI